MTSYHPSGYSIGDVGANFTLAESFSAPRLSPAIQAFQAQAQQSGDDWVIDISHCRASVREGFHPKWLNADRHCNGHARTYSSRGSTARTVNVMRAQFEPPG